MTPGLLGWGKSKVRRAMFGIPGQVGGQPQAFRAAPAGVSRLLCLGAGGGGFRMARGRLFKTGSQEQPPSLCHPCNLWFNFSAGIPLQMCGWWESRSSCGLYGRLIETP